MNALRIFPRLTRTPGQWPWPTGVPCPGMTRRGYSAIMGVLTNHCGEVVRVQFAGTNKYPDPNKSRMSSLSDAEAEATARDLVYNLRIEIFGDSAKFYKIDFDETLD